MRDIRGLNLLELLAIIAGVVLLVIVIVTLRARSTDRAEDDQRVLDLAAYTEALDTYRTSNGTLPCGTERPVVLLGWYGNSDNPLFLNGADEPTDECPDGSWSQGTNTGLFTFGILTDRIDDPVNVPAHRYWYFTDRTREHAVLLANLRDSQRERDDDGLCEDAYETGDLEWWRADPFRGAIIADASPCCLVTDTCP